MAEKVSIIIAVGVPGAYIEECIEHCLKLDYPDFEIIALPGSRVRYSTIQNWSTDVYNLVTKRAVAYKDAAVEWVDGNIGSKRTMKYPSIYLMGERAHGEERHRPL